MRTEDKKAYATNYIT